MNIDAKMIITVKICANSDKDKEVIFELDKTQAEELYSRLGVLLNKSPYITYTVPEQIYTCPDKKYPDTITTGGTNYIK